MTLYRNPSHLMSVINHIHSIPMKFLVSLQVVLFCFSFIPLQADAAGNDTDKLALLKLKESLSGDSNGIFNSWNDSIHHCNWYGVTCNGSHGRVSNLVLQGLKLLGSISPYIGNLSFLTIIDLANNSLRGEIPSEIGSLFQLQSFSLNNNTLEGEIPVSLSNCSQLKILDLQYNRLVGKIPAELGSLQFLEVIALTQNHLTGEIPASLTNITSLHVFAVQENELVGSVPESVGRLVNLYGFSIGMNRLSGVFPSSIFNISSMRFFVTTQNQLEGSLPENIGLTLPNLELFSIATNNFSGSIPSSLSNASKLEKIALSNNKFSGQVPTSFGNLQRLQWIVFFGNYLGSNSSKDLEFLTSLTNCSNLQHMYLSSNNFGGVLPDSMGNFSSQLHTIYLDNNQISGTIPAALQSLVNLEVLSISNNLLTGVIPSFIGKFHSLQKLLLNGNKLSGQIPSSIGNLTQLFDLSLNGNKLEGTIPVSIGNCQRLQVLELSQNNLSGVIPQEVIGLPSISKLLNLSQNSLTGNLPAEVGKLKNIQSLDVSENKISGEIPSSIGDCASLEYLYMGGNSFTASIPSSLASLKVLQHLDLSRNNFTGQIPEGLQEIPFLFLNLSFNDLEGEVPTEGIFRNASAVSLLGNRKLCGGVSELSLPKCPPGGVQKQSKHISVMLAIIIACSVLFMLSMVASALVYWVKKSKQKKSSASEVKDGLEHTSYGDGLVRVSYRDIYQGTDGFSSNNLLGSGSFGSVYKGILNGIKKPVAIKVLNLEQKGASKSFKAECRALQNVRHRNLVKIVTSCSSIDHKGDEFKALVFELMVNGNLDRWLHPAIDDETRSARLNFRERLNIAIDVASAIHYLHDLCETPIVHCDLKPSNILLDDDMVAHVCDFGLARLFSEDLIQTQVSTIGLVGTVGYAPPEYGTGAAASKYGDVYSYGILLLEMFTGKRPTDEIFKDGISLHDYVKASLRNQLLQIVDPILLPAESVAREEFASNDVEQKEDTKNYRNLRKKEARVLNCLISVLEIGVNCSAESPKGRMDIEDVISKLQSIKSTVLGI